MTTLKEKPNVGAAPAGAAPAFFLSRRMSIHLNQKIKRMSVYHFGYLL